MKKTISAEVQGRELRFEVTTEAYNKYLNEVSQNNKIAPAKNFLRRTVKAECKEDLMTLMQIPSLAPLLCSSILEEYTPDVEIIVGESKSASND